MSDAEARRTFLHQYATIRHSEGRGSRDPAYYRALPYRDLTGRNSAQWEIRGRSYRYLEQKILAADQALRILDLGAGTGWMSWRLSQRGHRAVAVDIFTDALDGLGAIRNFDTPIPAIAGDFDSLPFRDASFDVVIFNSSLHYASDYRRTLAEAGRVLRPAGRVLIVDSPVYARAEHGERMRSERQTYFEKTYGFRSDALRSIEYLDEGTIERLAEELGIEWSRGYPWYGWRWALRPWRARIKRERPPSRFFILTGRFRSS